MFGFAVRNTRRNRKESKMFSSSVSMQDMLTLFEVARYAVIVLLILCGIGMILSAVRYVQGHDIGMLYAGADFVVTDKKINTGLFNTTYEVTIALPEPPEGGVATLRLRITEDQYNKTRIGDTWHYQSDY